MPTQARREDVFIERFVLGYENRSWEDAEIDWLDKRVDGAVEAVVTRKSDGKTLAIEHTIVEPFVGEKEDFAFFERAFLRIEEDFSLPVPGRWIRVFVPVGTLRHQRKKEEAIVGAVHEWLKENRLSLPDGETNHHCPIYGILGKPALDITLCIKVVALPGPGKLHIRRQQVDDNFSEVVERALMNKLPKLAKTVADKRILLLERQHMNLLPSRMLAEIEAQRAKHPDLANVHEIWIIETMSWEADRCLFFECFRCGNVIDTFGFSDKEFFE